MTENVILFIIGQSVLGLGTAFAVYVGIMKAITRQDERQIALDERVTAHREDHKSLDKRVHGISRTVERHDAILDPPVGKAN